MDGRVIFAGGGTGGHLYPALAILEALRRRAGDGVEALFVCSQRPLDAEILHAEGHEGVAIPARPFSMRPLGLVRFCRTWGPSLRACRGVVRGMKSEGEGVVVVAMGGFVAAPAAQAARVEMVPLVLVNLDAAPGKANKWIARRADRVVTALPVAGRDAGGGGREWECVGPIVRSAAVAGMSMEACKTALGLDASRPVLMVMGGSQGARSLNQFVTELARREGGGGGGGGRGGEGGAMREWQVLHQTGKDDEEVVRAAYSAAGVRAVVSALVRDVGLWWGAADLVVARSGAGAVAEAWANRAPAVFMPYPYHRDQHQKLNAQPLVEAGGAVVVEDRIDAAANMAANADAVVELLKRADQRAAMRRSLERLGPATGADRTAEVILGLV